MPAELITKWFLSACMVILCSACSSIQVPPFEHDQVRNRYEIDHLFIMCQPFAPEMTSFELKGFLRWPYTVQHTEQGTRGRYIRFDNFYLEFLWVFDENAAIQNIPFAHSDFVARSNGLGSPIGIGLRDLEYDSPTPTPTLKYSAGWMGDPDRDFIDVFTPKERLSEPWVFRMPPHWTVPPRESYEGWMLGYLDHDISTRLLTGLRVTCPVEVNISDALREIESECAIVFREGQETLVEMTFDDHSEDMTIDFRPELPIMIYY